MHELNVRQTEMYMAKLLESEPSSVKVETAI
jgi:hypothetical protein